MNKKVLIFSSAAVVLFLLYVAHKRKLAQSAPIIQQPTNYAQPANYLLMGNPQFSTINNSTAPAFQNFNVNINNPASYTLSSAYLPLFGFVGVA